MKNTFYRGYQLTVAPYEVRTQTDKKWKVKIQIVDLTGGSRFEETERESFTTYVEAQEVGFRKAKSMVNNRAVPEPALSAG